MESTGTRPIANMDLNQCEQGQTHKQKTQNFTKQNRSNNAHNVFNMNRVYRVISVKDLSGFSLARRRYAALVRYHVDKVNEGAERKDHSDWLADVRYSSLTVEDHSLFNQGTFWVSGRHDKTNKPYKKIHTTLIYNGFLFLKAGRLTERPGGLAITHSKARSGAKEVCDNTNVVRLRHQLDQVIREANKLIVDVKPKDATQLKRGHHISVPGRKPLFRYRHHAIIVEVKENTNSRKATVVVIHTPNPKHKKGRRIVREEKEYDVNEILIREYTFSKYTLEEVAQNAEQHCNSNCDRRYNLCNMNCEHFCTECAIGIHMSHQVLNAPMVVAKCPKHFLHQKIVRVYAFYVKENGCWNVYIGFALIILVLTVFPFLFMKLTGISRSLYGTHDKTPEQRTG
ncbi:hypothetical protein MAR_033439 [Mya arenaria]|uniref:LRAT domain-containing protein n=1 Tax=Mya arenaria TaxID=6604 RepID=A0ABY7GC16_MYAAR|nr:hypothetical protein MAR_033439 [Mya arenaria]